MSAIYLDQGNIVVKDMDAMAAFYARLGLDVRDGGTLVWQPHHREVPTDGATIELDSEPFAAMWNQGPARRHGRRVGVPSGDAGRR